MPAHEHHLAVEELSSLLFDRHGLDLAHYKSVNILRRVERRMTHVGLDSIKKYLSLLRADANELETLYRDLLIGVTRFFRDPEAFSRLEEYLPTLFRQADPKGLRVWIAGCATGQEAYSIGALLLEYAQTHGIDSGRIKIFATDVNKESLAVASAGLYSAELIESGPETLRKFFVGDDGMYRAHADLRRMIIFAQHDLLKDPPFTRLDLVCCRNVLIYLNQDAQRRILSIFHFALRKKGTLFLGPSETLGDMEREFDAQCYRSRLFNKRRSIRLKEPIRIGQLNMPRARPAIKDDAMVHQAFHTLLQRYVPPTLMVDDRNQVVHVFGDAFAYLTMGTERTNYEVDAVIHPDLRIPLNTTLHRIKRTKTPTSCASLSVTLDSRQRIEVNLIAEVIRDQRLRSDLYLISIERQPGPRPNLPKKARFGSEQPHARMLQQELEQKSQVLQATLDLLPTPAWVLTEKGEPRALNRAAHALKRTYPGIDDLWNNRRAPLWKKMRETAEEQRPRHAHCTVARSTGSTEFECRLTPADGAAGRPRLIILTILPIDDASSAVLSSKHTDVSQRQN
ncbi:MAG: protein-glutamate O-methyltransferase CheR [Myxococcota bacterium]